MTRYKHLKKWAMIQYKPIKQVFFVFYYISHGIKTKAAFVYPGEVEEAWKEIEKCLKKGVVYKPHTEEEIEFDKIIPCKIIPKRFRNILHFSK